MTPRLHWSRRDQWHTQAEGYTVCAALVGDRIAYSLWCIRTAPHRLLETLTGLDRTDDQACRVAAAYLKDRAEEHRQGAWNG